MKPILVVVPPGPMQEGLQVLLAALPNVTVVVVTDLVAAKAQIAIERPHLALVAGADVVGTVEALVGECTGVRFLALVQKPRRIAPAEAAGADAVLVEGAPAGRLLAAIRSLLAETSDDQTEVKR